jgi:hypothetical protein
MPFTSGLDTPVMLDLYTYDAVATAPPALTVIDPSPGCVDGNLLRTGYRYAFGITARPTLPF